MKGKRRQDSDGRIEEDWVVADITKVDRRAKPVFTTRVYPSYEGRLISIFVPLYETQTNKGTTTSVSITIL